MSELTDMERAELFALREYLEKNPEVVLRKLTYALENYRQDNFELASLKASQLKNYEEMRALRERIAVLEAVRDAAIVYLDDTCVRTEESLIDAVDAARSGE